MGKDDYCFIYVVLLDLPPAYKKPGVYVGTTKELPLERFLKHKRGEHASRWVRRFGVRVIETRSVRCKDAMIEEERMARRYRKLGCEVKGGH